MRALVIDNTAKAEITRVLSYAQKHVLKVAELIENLKGNIVPAGNNPEHVCHFFDGFRVVYSIEDQPHLGLCHHLSVSVNTKGRTPSPQAIELLMKEFGIPGTLDDCVNVWVENGIAINVLQEVKSGENNDHSV
jgi:hypothetical protein